MRTDSIRRRSLIALAGASLAAPSVFAQRPVLPSITANEQLMYEHGLVGRVNMIYRHAISALRAGESIDPDHVGTASGIVAGIIHGIHELEEENILFPLLLDSRYAGMTHVLRGQHRVARVLTGEIGNNLTAPRLKDSETRRRLSPLAASTRPRSSVAFA